MVDHCGQGLFHHIAWQNRPIQIITVGGPGYLGIWEYLLDIPGTPSPDQQFSRATILAYDRQVAVVCHYPHLILSLFSYAFVRGGACGDDGGDNRLINPCQQPHNCLVLKASLANECCEFKLRIRVGIRTAKSDGDGSLSRHGPRNGCWGVLLIGKFTFPFRAGATVGADEKKSVPPSIVPSRNIMTPS